MNAELFIYFINFQLHICGASPSPEEIRAWNSSWSRVCSIHDEREFMRKTFWNYWCWTRPEVNRLVFLFHWNNKLFRFSFLPKRIMSHHSPYLKSPFVSTQSSVEFCFPFVSLSLPLSLSQSLSLWISDSIESPQYYCMFTLAVYLLRPNGETYGIYGWRHSRPCQILAVVKITRHNNAHWRNVEWKKNGIAVNWTEATNERRPLSEYCV